MQLYQQRLETLIEVGLGQEGIEEAGQKAQSKATTPGIERGGKIGGESDGDDSDDDDSDGESTLVNMEKTLEDRRWRLSSGGGGGGGGTCQVKVSFVTLAQ